MPGRSGFYGHFESKEDLAVEACERVLAHAAETWPAMAAKDPEAPLDAESEQTSVSAGVSRSDPALLDAFSRIVVAIAEHCGPAVVGIRRRAPEHDPDNPFAPVLGSARA